MTGSVAGAMADARLKGVDRLDVQLLLCHLLGRPRAWVLAHDNIALNDEQWAQLQRWIERRVAGEPLAYLIGEKEFHGLMLQVSPAVLIPRPDTETLVDWALELMKPMAAPAVLDMGTGSGAIAIALKHRHPDADVMAVDVSDAALALAQSNAQRLQKTVRFLKSDWWSAVAHQRFDFIVSNPPYIAEGDSHLAGLTHEPLLALTSGPAGLDALARIAAQAPRHLNPGGWLLFEHGHEQSDAVAKMLRQIGFSSLATRHDLAGRPRCTGGRTA